METQDTKYKQSLTHLRGRMRPEKVRDVRMQSQQSNVHRETATWLPKGFVEPPRFEIPQDVRVLTDFSPLQYLTRYCIVSSRVKKLLYHRQYAKYREAKVDGIDSLDKVRRALKDVCTFSVSARSFSPSDNSIGYYLHGILGLELNEPVNINFKNFLGMAALAERIFNPSYMDSWCVSLSLLPHGEFNITAAQCHCGIDRWRNEKELESDYVAYKQLREKEEVLRFKMEERETEQIRQRGIKEAEHALRLAKRQSAAHGSDKEVLLRKASEVILEASSSEHLLAVQVQENRVKLENKISITKILELERRPRKCPKDLMEHIDFHAIKWKLKDVPISTAMQRILRIILNL